VDLVTQMTPIGGGVTVPLRSEFGRAVFIEPVTQF
jgi:hypothetical protein